MATLNTRETEALRSVASLLSEISRNGYVPDEALPTDHRTAEDGLAQRRAMKLQRGLVAASKDLHEIIQKRDTTHHEQVPR